MFSGCICVGCKRKISEEDAPRKEAKNRLCDLVWGVPDEEKRKDLHAASTVEVALTMPHGQDPAHAKPLEKALANPQHQEIPTRGFALPKSRMLRFRLTQTSQLLLQRGDLTRWSGDAIVNAANEFMLGGGGVDGAIHRAAGPRLRRACLEVEPVKGDIRCPTGEARHTPAFNLDVQYVIHTVGPVFSSHEESGPLLESAYRSSLELANELQISKVAFPAISCGIFGYPLRSAAKVSLGAVKENVGALKEVHFVFFEYNTMVAFEQTAREMFDEIEHVSEGTIGQEDKQQPRHWESEIEMQESAMDVDMDENEDVNGLNGDADDESNEKGNQAANKTTKGMNQMDICASMDPNPKKMRTEEPTEQTSDLAAEKPHPTDKQGRAGGEIDASKSKLPSPEKITSNQGDEEKSPDVLADKTVCTDNQEQGNGEVSCETKGEKICHGDDSSKEAASGKTEL